MAAFAATGETVGVLYPGEMGATLARLLRQRGVAVVTTVEGRGPRTERLALESGAEVVRSARELAARANVVLSVVAPAAAEAVAEEYRACLPLPARTRYVDLNSVSPETVGTLEALFRSTGVELVDGAIHGLAAHLPDGGTVYLSGPAAGSVGELLGRAFRVRVLGDRVGRASAFKMLISGMAKGVAALFLEMSVAAREAGLLDELLACYREAYPGVMAVVDRTLATYPQHAPRRADEMREVEQTLRGLGLSPRLVSATQSLIDDLGRLRLAEREPGRAGAWSVPEVVAAAHARGLLRRAGGESGPAF